jgi:hypothetical protein
MKRKQITEEEVIDKIDTSFDSMEKLRSEGLERIKLLHSIKNKALEKEQERLSTKLGAEHPRVKKMATRMQYSQGLFKDIDVEIEKAKIKFPSFDKNSWMVHGRVLDKDKNGIGGLTVGLYDEKGNCIKRLGYGCTDKQGYFSIIYRLKEGAESEVTESMKLFLYTSDRNYRILYKDNEPLYLSIGQIDYREIYLSEGEICPPPESEKREVPPLKGEIGEIKLEDIEGIGTKSADKLRKAGIKDVKAFSEADDEEIKKILGDVNVSELKKKLQNRLKKAREASDKDKEK